MSVIGLLGVCFVVMKILGLIDWSWWLVTAPFWGGLVFGIVFTFVVELYKAWPRGRRNG